MWTSAGRVSTAVLPPPRARTRLGRTAVSADTATTATGAPAWVSFNSCHSVCWPKIEIQSGRRFVDFKLSDTLQVHHFLHTRIFVCSSLTTVAIVTWSHGMHKPRVEFHTERQCCPEKETWEAEKNSRNGEPDKVRMHQRWPAQNVQADAEIYCCCQKGTCWSP